MINDGKMCIYKNRYVHKRARRASPPGTNLFSTTSHGITLTTVDGMETLTYVGAGRHAKGMTVATRRAAALSLKAVARSGLNLDTRYG